MDMQQKLNSTTKTISKIRVMYVNVANLQKSLT